MITFELELILTILTSFFIVLFATPVFIKIAYIKKLFDVPGEDRKLHKNIIPSMGGIMIFAGVMFSFTLFFPADQVHDFKYLIPCAIVLFFVGVKDDIIGTAPVKKLIAHLIVAFIMVLMADIRLSSLHGLLGVREIPYAASVLLSVFTYIVIVNAFNLIDGVDGLAGGVGFLVSIAFGIWFYLSGDEVYGVLAFSLAGAILGFLRYNFNPAKIFMGDSGSLLIGFLIAVMAIELVEYDKSILPERVLIVSKPLLAMTILVIPLLDTARIFIYRAAKGMSPFRADKNHIHHKLMFLGFGHRGTVVILLSFNIVFIAILFAIRNLDPNIGFVIMSAVSLLALIILHFLKPRK
jgi:UDP-N-acetylmuramyl pentapeptide phosphotransferase/UDP-N-acetylglucosamine-1-phosphate transferase